MDAQRYAIENEDFLTKYGKVHADMADALNAIRIRILEEEGLRSPEESSEKEVFIPKAKRGRPFLVAKIKQSGPGRPRIYPIGPQLESAYRSSDGEGKRKRGRPRKVVQEATTTLE